MHRRGSDWNITCQHHNAIQEFSRSSHCFAQRLCQKERLPGSAGTFRCSRWNAKVHPRRSVQTCPTYNSPAKMEQVVTSQSRIAIIDHVDQKHVKITPHKNLFKPTSKTNKPQRIPIVRNLEAPETKRGALENFREGKGNHKLFELVSYIHRRYLAQPSRRQMKGKKTPNDLAKASSSQQSGHSKHLPYSHYRSKNPNGWKNQNPWGSPRMCSNLADRVAGLRVSVEHPSITRSLKCCCAPWGLARSFSWIDRQMGS